MSYTGFIPARGGSKGVRRKNLAVINGKPLVLHVADTLAQVVERVVVCTEDAEIAGVARVHGYEVLDRPPELATDEATVDQVVGWAADTLGEALLVVQPTVPEVTPDLLRAFISEATPPAVMVVPDHHIMWRDGAPITHRMQRQDGDTWREVGVRLVPAGPHIGYSCWQAPAHLIDIDTNGDLAAVRQRMGRKRIVFRVTATKDVGSGHVYRCLALADLLQHHRIGFALTDGSEDWAHDLIASRGYPVNDNMVTPHLVVHDMLDTDMAHPYGPKQVHLEDLGPGARFADLVVNALYPAQGFRNEVHGPDWCVLRPEFLGVPYDVRPEASRVLVTFGGTDPSRLTERLMRLLASGYEARIIPPPGRELLEAWAGAEQVTRPSMAAELQWADVVVTSAGRTVYEAAAVGTPTIVLAQNAREATHCHLGFPNNIFLGLGKLVSDETIRHTIDALLGDLKLRQELSNRRSIDGKGALRIVRRIEDILEGI